MADDPLEPWVSKLPSNPNWYVYLAYSGIGCSDAGVSDNRDLSSLVGPLIPAVWEVEVGRYNVQSLPRLQSKFKAILDWGGSLGVESLPGVCKGEGSVSIR